MRTDYEFLVSLRRSVIVKYSKSKTNGYTSLSPEGKEEVDNLFSLLKAVYFKILSIDESNRDAVRRAMYTFLRNIKPAKSNGQSTHTRRIDPPTSTGD